MKRIIILMIVLILGVIGIGAHRINGYRYLAINSQGNPFDVEIRMEKFFTKLGFKIVRLDDFPELSREQGEEALIADYQYDIVYDGHSSLKLTLKNVAGDIIFTSKAYGISFSAKGDMKRALNKIFDQITNLNYKFTPKSLASTKDNGLLSLDNDSLENVIKKIAANSSNPIEGIYNSFNDDGTKYRIGIIESSDKGTFGGIIIESNMRTFKKGDVIFELTSVGSNQYVGDYKFNTQYTGRRVVATLEGRMLKIQMGKADKAQIFIYAKVFPETNASGGAEASSNVSTNKQKARYSGSGVVISGNIIATNYHVIKDENQIGIVFNENDGAKEYNAKILCVDKQNDLALLSIKDSKYKPIENVPYTIASNLEDVGTKVFSMGYPLTQYLGDEIKTTDGIISSKTGYQGDITSYQISAPIQPGNSGGALFDLNGNLIGITSAGVQAADNVGYAIKSSYLLNLIESAPIEISVPKATNVSSSISSLVKKYTPYIVYIKVY